MRSAVRFSVSRRVLVIPVLVSLGVVDIHSSQPGQCAEVTARQLERRQHAIGRSGPFMPAASPDAGMPMTVSDPLPGTTAGHCPVACIGVICSAGDGSHACAQSVCKGTSLTGHSAKKPQSQPTRSRHHRPQLDVLRARGTGWAGEWEVKLSAAPRHDHRRCAEPSRWCPCVGERQRRKDPAGSLIPTSIWRCSRNRRRPDTPCSVADTSIST